MVMHVGSPSPVLCMQGISELAPGSILSEGMPIFRTMAGEVIKFSREKHASSVPEGGDVYPVFVNEAAYYEQVHAFVLCSFPPSRRSLDAVKSPRVGEGLID